MTNLSEQSEVTATNYKPWRFTRIANSKNINLMANG